MSDRIQQGDVELTLFKRLFNAVLDDNRVYYTRFSKYDVRDGDMGLLKELVEVEAKRLEQTANCVAEVVVESGLGLEDQIALVVFVPRHADREFVEQLCNTAQHRVYTESYEQDHE